MYIMGNNNKPKRYNEFPRAGAPNEVEIIDVTSCTNDLYPTLADGTGIRSIGTSQNVKIIDGDTLSVPKIETNDIKTCINESTTGQSDILLVDEENNIVKNNGLSYNSETETLNAENISTTDINATNINATNVTADCVSATSMGFENINANCGSFTTVAATNFQVPNFDMDWVEISPTGSEDKLYCLKRGPITYICIPAGSYSCTWYECWKKCIFWNDYYGGVARDRWIMPIVGSLCDLEGTRCDCAPFRLIYNSNHEDYYVYDNRNCCIGIIGGTCGNKSIAYEDLVFVTSNTCKCQS